jgi:hypothetical protein
MEQTSPILVLTLLMVAPPIAVRSHVAADGSQLDRSAVQRTGEPRWFARSRLARAEAEREIPISVRPFMLAEEVSTLAGHAVKVWEAKVVGVFEPNVFLVESATRSFRDRVGFRDRVIVLINPGALRVPATLLVGSAVTIFGVARTVLGLQVSREVPWPEVLDQKLTERLEIRAAVLARSVQTAEGVELTDNPPLQQQPLRARPR